VFRFPPRLLDLISRAGDKRKSKEQSSQDPEQSGFAGRKKMFIYNFHTPVTAINLIQLYKRKKTPAKPAGLKSNSLRAVMYN